MSPGRLWQQFEEEFDRPSCLPKEDKCFFAREYISGGGFKSSAGNSLISNLKKKPCHRDEYQWKYKVEAIQQFAKEISVLLPRNISVAPIPSSKASGHPDYDSRIDDVLLALQKRRPDIILVKPLIRTISIQAQHERDTRASVEEISLGLVWQGLPSGTNHLVLLDDVVTVGKTYHACREIVHKHVSDIKTYGVFWARTIWNADGC